MLRVYLCNPESGFPLYKVYESENYTQAFMFAFSLNDSINVPHWVKIFRGSEVDPYVELPKK